MTQPLEQFCAAIPNNASLSKWSSVSGVHFKPEIVSNYVPPTLKGIYPERLQEDKPSVFLISAPGAMGKTQAARFIARSVQAPYLDLSAVRVGSGTFDGLLSRSFGDGYGEFRKSLREGHSTVVIDSTDEAVLRSGIENYREFLKNIVELLSSASISSRVVMLGRTDSIFATESILHEFQVASHLLELAPLAYVQAADYIDGVLDQDKNYQVHRDMSEPFGRLRDYVLADLASSLRGDNVQPESLRDQWALTQDFLGYPPVLTALTARLKVSNPQNEISRLEGIAPSEGRKNRGEVLRSIVENILDRENQKVANNVGNSLGMAPNDPLRKRLYTRDEQAARLLQHTGVAGVNVDRPAVLPESDRERYEELIRSFLKDHPFLRAMNFSSVVFSDYLRAWSATGPAPDFMTRDAAKFRATLPKAGPFFARFMGALAESAEDPCLAEDLVDDVIKSHLASSGSAEATYRHLEDDTAVLHLYDSSEDMAEDFQIFQVREMSGVLVLKRPIMRVGVHSKYSVVLDPDPEGRIEFGPRVVIVADEVEIAGKAFKVVAGGKDSVPSIILAKEAAKHDADLKVTVFTPRSLVVSWPDMWHQFKPHVLPPINGARSISPQLSTQIIVAVRRILSSFRRTSRNAPAVSSDLVDRILVGANTVVAGVRDGMLELGVIWQDNQQYYLSLEELSNHGLSYADLQATDPYQSLSTFSNTVINTSAFKDNMHRMR